MEAISDWLSPSIAWFLVGVILLLLELALPSLILMFFGIGAWATAISCLSSTVETSTGAQFIIFTLVSTLCLILLRNRLKELFHGDQNVQLESAEDDFIGKIVLVTQEINAGAEGKVEIHGSNWKASSEETIAKGTRVRVLEKDNLTVKVETI
jgi:membrane protein implicated in regulation of membrane protease activity